VLWLKVSLGEGEEQASLVWPKRDEKRRNQIFRMHLGTGWEK